MLFVHKLLSQECGAVRANLRAYAAISKDILQRAGCTPPSVQIPICCRLRRKLMWPLTTLTLGAACAPFPLVP